MSTHMAWRWNTTHELPKSRRACTDEADNTITSPTTTRALTTMARRTNSGVERARVVVGGGDDRRRAWRTLRRPGRRARVRSVVAGTGTLLEELGDGAPEVVA